jgi:hypothetical protein
MAKSLNYEVPKYDIFFSVIFILLHLIQNTFFVNSCDICETQFHTHTEKQKKIFRLAAPQLKRLVAGFPPRRPGFDPGSGQVGYVVDKVALRQVFSEYFGFPCQSLFDRKSSILTITRGRYNRTVNGRGAEWTQFGLHPPLCANKKNK